MAVFVSSPGVVGESVRAAHGVASRSMIWGNRRGDGACRTCVLAVALAVGAVQMGCATGTGDDTAGSSSVASDSGIPSPSPSPSGAPTNNYGYMGDSAALPPGMPVDDAGATSPTASSTGMCSSNPKYLLELFTTMDAGACPCAASECCFSGLVCLPL